MSTLRVSPEAVHKLSYWGKKFWIEDAVIAIWAPKLGCLSQTGAGILCTKFMHANHVEHVGAREFFDLRLSSCLDSSDCIEQSFS